MELQNVSNKIKLFLLIAEKILQTESYCSQLKYNKILY